MALRLKQFAYGFRSGPLPKIKLKEEGFSKGNCRLAVQYYLYKIHGLFIEPEQILNPQGYKELGRFVIRENKFDEDSFIKLKDGDIIYAEKISRNRKEQTYEKWLISLHSAVYMSNGKVYHSSARSGGSAVWTVEKFCQFYRPVAAKRVLKLL